ncbi:hypothetical protein [Brucella sp. 10RB9215]|nr:hypothetical protein [Brucella sp. 10RB9215]
MNADYSDLSVFSTFKDDAFFFGVIDSAYLAGSNVTLIRVGAIGAGSAEN